MKDLESFLRSTLAYPIPSPAFSAGLLHALRESALYVVPEPEADTGGRDPRWAVFGAVGAAGAACYVFLRRHHQRRRAA